MNNTLQSLTISLSNALEMNVQDANTEEAILDILTSKVAYEMEYNPEHFFSLLYRLDISEQKIKQVLHTQNDVPKKIAVLIYERQLEKIISRQQFRHPSQDQELSW